MVHLSWPIIIKLIKEHPEFVSHKEGTEIDPNGEMTAFCEFERKGQQAQKKYFSLEDAKKLNVLDRAVWKHHLKEMLLARARRLAAQSMFPDILNKQEANA